MEKLKKVIIPIAGLGTRMLPATKAIPKEMLPIGGKPIIQHIVEEVKDAGFSEIIFITHSSKYSVENHFDTSFELEASLEKRIKRSLLKEMKKISKLGISIQSIRQGQTKGLGHAILCAKSILKENEPFAVVLPDMLLERRNSEINLSKMKSYFDETRQSSILLGRVNKKDISNYGVAKVKVIRNSSKFGVIEKIIEKPSLKQAPSNLVAVGRYIFNYRMMSFLSKVKPDKDDEIQLTNAIQQEISSNLNTIHSLELEGNFFDCGTKLGYQIANFELFKSDPAFGAEFKKYVRKNI